MEKEEQIFRNRIQELAGNAYRRDVPVHTDFLTLNEQTIFQTIAGSRPPVRYALAGGYEAAERKVVCFLPSYEEVLWEPPFECLRISPLNAKFAEALTHRDYLGAIMNLGVERSVMGDILVHGTEAYVFVLKEMSRYLAENLVSVRHTSVSVTPCEAVSVPAPEYDEITGSVSSLRIDSIAALAGRLSRAKAVSLIEGEKVFLNGRLVLSASQPVHEGDILSIRGIGKFSFAGEGSQTKKGRTMVTLRQYK